VNSYVEVAEEALALLERVHRQADREAPPLLEFRAEGGCALGVGLGREVSVVTYQRSLEPPYFISLGSVARESTWFCYASRYSEYIASNLVSIDVAKRAVSDFFESEGGRSNQLEWEEL
jgi:hypothetical protein